MYGAWRLARLDTGAMAWFDRSAHGVWRSFWAMALAYPGFLVLLALRPTPDQSWFVPSVPTAIVESIGYVIGWTALPLIIFEIWHRFRREEQALDFIVAYNWAQLLQILPSIAIALIGSALTPTLAVALNFTLWVALIGYEWFIARVALRASGLVTTAVVLLDLVLGMGLGEVAQSLY
jgi:hypothetical protein